jgi:hypothetical protein
MTQSQTNQLPPAIGDDMEYEDQNEHTIGFGYEKAHNSI